MTTKFFSLSSPVFLLLHGGARTRNCSSRILERLNERGRLCAAAISVDTFNAKQ